MLRCSGVSHLPSRDAEPKALPGGNDVVISLTLWGNETNKWSG